MRKTTLIISIIFAVHIVEEVLFAFWNSDPFTLFASNLSGLSLGMTYGLVQLAGGLIVALACFGGTKYRQLFSFALGIILISEITHVIAAVYAHAYAPGLITGVALVVLAIPYWTALLRDKND